MQNIIDETGKIVQYGDDIFIFVADKFVNIARQRLENNIAKLVEYFESHRLNLNEEKNRIQCLLRKFPEQINEKSQITSEKSLHKSQSFCNVSWSLLSAKSNLRKCSETCPEENGLWH